MRRRLGRMAAIGLLVLGMGLGEWFLQSEEARAKAEVSRLEAELNTDQALAGEVRVLEAEARTVKPGGAVPARLDSVALVTEFQDAASVAGVRITALSIGSPAPKSGLFAFPVSVTLAGPESGQARFLHVLEENARLAQVVSWTATSTGGTAVVDVFAETGGDGSAP